ncbi:hypothetical protein ABZY44_37535 [Streptomyces sp. NPDC006544]|uniref:hypothetical protein n=1 Tax=Streptomyces sp. NPDC006544 TaxID=3154583 RepID=UPI0033BF1453
MSTIQRLAVAGPDEIRSASQVDVPDATVSEKEVDAAVALAETLSGTDMSELRDEYREALEKVIQAKAAGARLEPVEAPAPASAQVVDLMAVLERSVSEPKAARRGPDATVHDLPAKKTTKKTTRPRSRPRSRPRRRLRAASPAAPEGSAALDSRAG